MHGRWVGCHDSVWPVASRMLADVDPCWDQGTPCRPPGQAAAHVGGAAPASSGPPRAKPGWVPIPGGQGSADSAASRRRSAKKLLESQVVHCPAASNLCPLPLKLQDQTQMSDPSPLPLAAASSNARSLAPGARRGRQLLAPGYQARAHAVPDDWALPADIALFPDGARLAFSEYGNYRVKVRSRALRTPTVGSCLHCHAALAGCAATQQHAQR